MSNCSKNGGKYLSKLIVRGPITISKRDIVEPLTAPVGVTVQRMIVAGDRKIVAV
jgi:hypothetical protein